MAGLGELIGVVGLGVAAWTIWGKKADEPKEQPDDDDQEDDDEDPEWDYPLDPDPVGPPPIPGLPPAPSGVCAAPRGTAQQEAILAQLPEPYQCQARTMLSNNPRWRTDLETVALNAEALGLTDIAAVLRQLTERVAVLQPGGNAVWSGTSDPDCPGAVMLSTNLEGSLANVPAPYRCQVREVINNNPSNWRNLVAALSMALRPVDPAAADALGDLIAATAEP